MDTRRPFTVSGVVIFWVMAPPITLLSDGLPAQAQAGGVRSYNELILIAPERCHMPVIHPSGETLGATVTGINLSQPLSDADFATIVLALGRHGVLRFPDQDLDAPRLRAFSSRFGGLQASVTGKLGVPGMPEVGILSNVIENGEPIGLADAGQDWHTDMSYNKLIGYTNVLYAVKVPRRDGKPLGATQFANMRAAYEDLAPEWKERLAGMTATHDF